MLLNWMPNSFIGLDATAGLHTKWLNVTRHDIGSGNIKLSTARRIYNRNRQSFARKTMDWSGLVDCLRTDEGTVHIVALVIKRAKALL